MLPEEILREYDDAYEVFENGNTAFHDSEMPLPKRLSLVIRGMAAIDYMGVLAEIRAFPSVALNPLPAPTTLTGDDWRKAMAARSI